MAVSLNVTEWMKGYIGLGATDVESGFMKGFDAETLFMHKILIHIDDVDKMIADPTCKAKVEGAVVCSAFGGKPCRVSDGTFNMHIDPRNPDLKLMYYRLPFTSEDGAQRTMLGQKALKKEHAQQQGFELWEDITKLQVRIYDGLVPGLDEPSAPSSASAPPPPPPLAMGIVYIEALDAFRSARSIRCPGASPEEATSAIEKFGAFYMDKLWKVYGKTAPKPTAAK